MAERKLIRLDTGSLSPPVKKIHDYLLDNIKGQDRAIKKLVDAYEGAVSGFELRNGPRFIAMFLGPSGVGKTLIPEVLAEYMFGSRRAFTKIECGGFSEPHTVSLLLGSPPGYVGFKEPNEDLTSEYPLLSQTNVDKYAFFAEQDSADGKARNERIAKLGDELKRLVSEHKRMKKDGKDNTKEYRDKENQINKLADEYKRLNEFVNFRIGGPQYDSVILFDEIEKAAVEVRNTLLQIMDKGVVTLRNGQLTNLQRSIIILTSNVGSRDVADIITEDDRKMGFKGKRDEGESKSRATQEIYEACRDAAAREFSPEFLGRLDELIVFQPLTREAFVDIFEVEMRAVYNRLMRSNFPLVLHIDPEVKDFVISRATTRFEFGARLLKHRISDIIEKPIIRLANRGPEEGIQKADELHLKLEKGRDGKERITFFRYERIKPDGIIKPSEEPKEKPPSDPKPSDSKEIIPAVDPFPSPPPLFMDDDLELLEREDEENSEDNK